LISICTAKLTIGSGLIGDRGVFPTNEHDSICKLLTVESVRLVFI
jgi:hypothetical protein